MNEMDESVLFRWAMVRLAAGKHGFRGYYPLGVKKMKMSPSVSSFITFKFCKRCSTGIMSTINFDDWLSLFLSLSSKVNTPTLQILFIILLFKAYSEGNCYDSLVIQMR